jgi:hypothetical protein
MAGIGSKFVQGAQWARSNTGQAFIGGGAALVGAAMIGQAYLRPPQAVSQSKYLGDLMFPGDLIDPSANRNSYISIKFQKYERRSIFSPAVGAGIEQGLRSGQGAGGAFGGIAAGAMNAANITLQKATTGVASALTGASAGEMLQLGGLAQNPFLTVLFKQPEFKKHTFSWKLAPNNAQESNTIKDIINAFKSNMLPAMAPNAGGTLLTYPNMAMINLYPDESFLYKFKPCVIESLNVNYAVGGQPSFFKGTNAPTLVQIDINLLEIEYWLKEDIEDNSFRSGGALFG